MSYIRKQYVPKTKTTYVYEVSSYWDKDKKMSRSRSKLLGKLNPDTGEVVPTGGRGRPRKTSPDNVPAPAKAPEAEVEELKKELLDARRRNAELDTAFRKSQEELGQLRTQLFRAATTLDSLRTAFDRHAASFQDHPKP